MIGQGKIDGGYVSCTPKEVVRQNIPAGQDQKEGGDGGGKDPARYQGSGVDRERCQSPLFPSMRHGHRHARRPPLLVGRLGDGTGADP